MLSKRWVQFFEGDNGQLSMTRLMVFMSFFPATYVVVLTLNSETLLYYIGGYVVGYIGGRGAQAYAERGQYAQPVKPRYRKR